MKFDYAALRLMVQIHVNFEMSRGGSVTSAARKAGVSESTMRDFLAGRNRAMTAATMGGLLKWMGFEKFSDFEWKEEE